MGWVNCIIILAILSCKLPFTEAIWLNLPSDGSSKCVSEEIRNNVVVVGDYVVIDENTVDHHNFPTVSVKVTSPYGNQVYHQENVTHGQFAFTANEVGSYVACFQVVSGHQATTLSIDWKNGITAKDWDAVAKKEHIEGVELELKKLEDYVDFIHEKLFHLQDKDWEMRKVSDKTNARVFWLSIMSLGVGITASIYQVWHLKRFFQKKKLI